MARASSFRTTAPRAPRVPAGIGSMRLLTLAEVEQPTFIAAWGRLAAQGGAPNPFYEPWFLLPSLRQWSASESAVIKAWYHDGRLSGLVPIVRSVKYCGHLVTHAKGGHCANAFCGVPLIAAGHEDAFWRAPLEIEALAQLAERLPINSVEYNRGDLPIGVDGTALRQERPHAIGLAVDHLAQRAELPRKRCAHLQRDSAQP